jgi:predicted dithiol-disulfide oxidoreductase (DUF899 family)
MSNAEIQALEQQIVELNAKLIEMRGAQQGERVPNYEFQTLSGGTSLLDLFGDNDRLLAIHNMGQSCRYCTLWADGFNGLLTHLESVMSVVLLSPDPPQLQRTLANSRGWRFRLASHDGGNYIVEQTVLAGENNMPGAVIYQRDGEGILRRSSAVFGPGDAYCSMWSLLGLAGLSEADWTPQFSYWRRPESLTDGGANRLD